MSDAKTATFHLADTTVDTLTLIKRIVTLLWPHASGLDGLGSAGPGNAFDQAHNGTLERRIIDLHKSLDQR